MVCWNLIFFKKKKNFHKRSRFVSLNVQSFIYFCFHCYFCIVLLWAKLCFLHVWNKTGFLNSDFRKKILIINPHWCASKLSIPFCFCFLYSISVYKFRIRKYFQLLWVCGFLKCFIFELVFSVVLNHFQFWNLIFLSLKFFDIQLCFKFKYKQQKNIICF